jgi:hypothetical protein
VLFVNDLSFKAVATLLQEWIEESASNGSTFGSVSGSGTFGYPNSTISSAASASSMSSGITSSSSKTSNSTHSSDSDVDDNGTVSADNDIDNFVTVGSYHKTSMFFSTESSIDTQRDALRQSVKRIALCANTFVAVFECPSILLQ